jgi:CO/xanthine dehydrogenase Mo-binding subunit
MTHTGIGSSHPRKGAVEKVTGKAQYCADISLPDLKYVVVLRSTQHHAKIIRLDTRKARQKNGVLAVLTFDDIPGERYYGEIIADRPALANGKVCFKGEPIAIIVADTRQIAEDARRTIEVSYELLPAVFDPEEAICDDTALIHPKGNLADQVNIQVGNIEEAFQQAEIVVEETFRVPRVYPAYLEPEATLGQWHQDDSITVWVSSQKPFDDRRMISKVLHLPEEKVIVKAAEVGGAFGGKEDASLAILAALAAWKLHGNVQIINSRQESFLGHPKRHPAIMHYKIGAKKDGTLLALQTRTYLDTGAYASFGPAVAQLHTETACGPYHIPNISLQTNVCYTNSPISGAMRGFGSPQANFAIESLMDILATRLDLDAVEIRQKNIWRSGNRSFTGAPINQVESLATCLTIAAEERSRLATVSGQKGKRSGTGIALAVQTMGLGHGIKDVSTCRLEWLPDGDLLLYLGATDLGQGLGTIAAQICAENMGMDYSRVRLAGINTSISPNGGTSCASRMTYLVGNSVIKASQSLIMLLIRETADMLNLDADKLQYQNGYIHRLDRPIENPIPVDEITSRLAEQDRRLIASGSFEFPDPPDTPDHLPAGMPHTSFCFGAQVAHVEVDIQTGIVEIRDIIAIHDVGHIINRHSVEGQIEGGVSMGIGYALYESMDLKQDGDWISYFSEYMLPTSLDISTRIKSIILENPEGSGPYGAKGIGEISTVPTAAAIVNAIYNATGKRLFCIPVRPEHLIDYSSRQQARQC